MRFENPHSLSYHENTFTNRSPTAIVSGASKIDEWGFPTMSTDTIGSSLYWRIFFSRAFDAAFIASFTAAALSGRAVWTATSISDPQGIGTRIEIPSIFPWSDGITSPIAFAAPVEVGIIDWAAERARRRSLCGASSTRWSFV